MYRQRGLGFIDPGGRGCIHGNQTMATVADDPSQSDLLRPYPTKIVSDFPPGETGWRGSEAGLRLPLAISWKPNIRWTCRCLCRRGGSSGQDWFGVTMGMVQTICVGQEPDMMTARRNRRRMLENAMIEVPDTTIVTYARMPCWRPGVQGGCADFA